MHGAAVFQVAAHGDFQAVQAALGFVDADQIEQGLAGVLVGAVAGVDYRHRGKFRRQPRRAVFGVALDDGVGVAGDDAGGVGQGFAFFGAGVGAVGKADHRAAQPLHGGFKRQTGAGGRLEKARSDQFAGQQVAARFGFEFQRGIQQQLQAVFAAVGHGNQVLSVKRVVHGVSFQAGKTKPVWWQRVGKTKHPPRCGLAVDAKWRRVLMAGFQAEKKRADYTACAPAAARRALSGRFVVGRFQAA